ncbi:MAG TPA: sugar phosphate isomerase/epimerase family protein [Planctomycetota bacterium]|nr:sugar phosphate isomerase/epimerase family protein [Planctomycetota bacterium]
MKKSINYWAFPGGGDGTKAIGEFLRESKAAGFQAVELCFAETGILNLNSDERQVRAIADDAKNVGIEIASVATGLYWKYSMTSDDLAMREKAKDVVKKGLQIAAWAGADGLLVIPGVVCCGFSPLRTPYGLAWQRALAAIKELTPVAERLRVAIGIENVWNGFLLSPLEMRHFIDEVNSPWVGAYFDVGNVVVTGYPEDWIRILGKRIRKVHFKDFKRSVGTLAGFVDLMKGDVNWPEVMKAFRETGYDGPLTAEVFPPKDHPERLITETSAAMDKIMGNDE